MSQHTVVDDVELDKQRPTSHASSVELPISLSFTSVASNTINAPAEPPTYNAYNADAEESFLPYLDDDVQAAKAAGAARASVSSRLTPRPLDSPQLAHLSPTPHTQPRSSTPPSDSPRDSPVIDRGAIRSDSPYNSPDLALAIPAAAEQQRNERQSLVAPAAATDRASNRYSKVLHGLGLFGAVSKRKSRADMSAPTNPKGLRIETSIAIDDEAESASQGSSGLRPQVSRSRSAGTSPLASPALTYKAPTAHHLIGGLAVNHAQGLSSSSSFASHEESKYPTSHNDQFSTGLVPVLNVDDAASSIYSANTPRRPYTPGSFTNGPRTPLSATASPTLGYFDEKKLAGSMGGSSVSLSLSPAGKADSAQDFKMWGDYDAESEPDDYLHEPDADTDKQSSKHMFSPRGMLNIGTLALLGVALLALFGGYPVIAWLSRPKASTKGGFNLGGINATGQVADLHIGRALVDRDTPNNVRTRTTLDGTGRKMNLVFSDEFNRDGRSFYPGDDPFWTAMDLHYWGTDNYEWYDPSAVTTANGSLVITLDQIPTHNLNFRGGMLQSWNQFCFTGGYIEVSMVLPGAPDVAGLWPAAWTMGNLGRAGYGASTDGMWPYTYDACDVGTLPNQTYANGTGPIAAQTTGVYVDKYGPGLSYLPGQRLSRCTCNNSDDHPGPRHADGSWVGRSAPEIDIIEASASHIRGSRGYASMSAQLSPFNSGYNLSDAPGSIEFFSDDAVLNTYTGSVYQQAASGLVYTKRGAYQETLGEFSSYGYEYKPGSDPDSYILWTLDGNPMWKLNSKALGPDPATEISQRPIPYEPMYILLNLGISASFTTIDWNRLKWPATMLVDYVRVWQVEGEENVGCDPENAPTAAYIEKHKEAYYNANLTTWTETRERGGYNQKFPEADPVRLRFGRRNAAVSVSVGEQMRSLAELVALLARTDKAKVTPLTVSRLVMRTVAEVIILRGIVSGRSPGREPSSLGRMSIHSAERIRDRSVEATQECPPRRAWALRRLAAASAAQTGCEQAPRLPTHIKGRNSWSMLESIGAALAFAARPCLRAEVWRSAPQDPASAQRPGPRSRVPLTETRLDGVSIYKVDNMFVVDHDAGGEPTAGTLEGAQAAAKPLKESCSAHRKGHKNGQESQIWRTIKATYAEASTDVEVLLDRKDWIKTWNRPTRTSPSFFYGSNM